MLDFKGHCVKNDEKWRFSYRGRTCKFVKKTLFFDLFFDIFLRSHLLCHFLWFSVLSWKNVFFTAAASGYQKLRHFGVCDVRVINENLMSIFCDFWCFLMFFDVFSSFFDDFLTIFGHDAMRRQKENPFRFFGPFVKKMPFFQTQCWKISSNPL